MPELPEVETIVRGLAAAIVGKRIERVEVRLPKIAVAPAGTHFERALAGDRVAGVRRRGKYAIVDLHSGRRLVTSLRMTGRLVVQRTRERDFAGTHVVLWFRGGRRLSFADVRTFGRMRLVEAGEPWDRDLGVEPLSPGFTVQAFLGMLAGRTTPIKALLLDQRRIAGIGNIYACEALWEARIRPSRPARGVDETGDSPATPRHRRRFATRDRYARHERRRLRGCRRPPRRISKRACGLRADSAEPCVRCGKPIVRTVLGQRGTWWCRNCQR